MSLSTVNTVQYVFFTAVNTVQNGVILVVGAAFTVKVVLFSDGTCTEWFEFGPCQSYCGENGMRSKVEACTFYGTEKTKTFTFIPCVTSCSETTKQIATINERGKWQCG